MLEIGNLCNEELRYALSFLSLDKYDADEEDAKSLHPLFITCIAHKNVMYPNTMIYLYMLPIWRLSYVVNSSRIDPTNLQIITLSILMGYFPWDHPLVLYKYFPRLNKLFSLTHWFIRSFYPTVIHGGNVVASDKWLHRTVMLFGPDT